MTRHAACPLAQRAKLRQSILPLVKKQKQCVETQGDREDSALKVSGEDWITALKR